MTFGTIGMRKQVFVTESVDLTPQSLMTGSLNICRFEEYMHLVIYSI